uniref:BPTI/Kunitz inhibitor domain-containing protein n=1 Tax=Heligmosomoides polygyrus TaxID=6339 RepID=A0A183G5F5_HELPZ
LSGTNVATELTPCMFRYYYDAEQGRCMAFTYNGALGNYNNFKSSADCELFCAKLQSANQRCSTNADCPSTHECQSDHNVCCPRPRKSSTSSRKWPTRWSSYTPIYCSSLFCPHSVHKYDT